MTRRGQVTVGLLAGILPALVLAAVAVMFVGVRANAERAQRFADAAALQAAVTGGSVSPALVSEQIGLGAESTLTLSNRARATASPDVLDSTGTANGGDCTGGMVLGAWRDTGRWRGWCGSCR
jgi:sorbitol-specific phosphotransferase system component IIC